MNIKKLPESELEVMLALWEIGENKITRAEIEERLNHKEWGVTTINSFLARLIDKGFISAEKRGKVNYYKYLISKEKYLAYEGKNILNKLYKGSLKNFILSVSSTDEISNDDIDELQEYLNMLKGRGEKDGEDIS